MIRPVKLTIKGFRSIKKEVVYDYTDGCTLLWGPNGSGKSSIASDALYWTLFGTSLIGKTAGNVINRDCSTAEGVLLANIDGIGPVTITQHRTRKSSSKLTVVNADNVDLLKGSGTSSRGKKLGLEALIGMSKETVRYVSFYTPAKGFMAQGYAERLSTLQEVLGVSWTGEARAKAADAEKAAVKERDRAAIAHARYSSAASELEASVTALTASVEKATVESVTVMEGRLERLKAEMDQTAKTREATLASISAAQGEYAVAERNANSLTAAILGLESTQADLLDKRASLGRDIAKWSTVEGHAVAELARIEGLVRSGKCPTCGKAVCSDDVRDTTQRAREEYAQAKTAVRDFESCTEVIGASITANSNRIRELKQSLSAANAALPAQRIAALQMDLAKQDAGLASARVAMSDLLDLAAHPEMDSGLSALRASLIGTKEKAIATRKDADNASASLALAEKMFAMAKWWNAALGPKGLPSFIVESALPRLEALANYYLRQMTGGQMGLTVTATHANEDGSVVEGIEVGVSNIAGIDSYDEDSTGEKRVADLSLTLAMFDLAAGDTGAGLGFLALDEALDPVDDSRVARVMEVLGTVAKTGRHVAIMSHSDRVRGCGGMRTLYAARGDDGWTKVVEE